jgi:signal transduction histidine kinase
MDEQTQRSTELNYMLRLPHPEQLVGIVQVMGARGASQSDQTSRLVAAADREGFLENAAYQEFQDLIRGAVEAIAYSDRELQLEQQKQEQKELLRELQRETREAIKEIEDNPHIQRSVKLSLVRSLTNTQQSAVQVSEYARERESTLEVMSLMGVVAGFMTHEFGVAVNDLERAHDLLVKASSKNKQFTEEASRLAERIASLKEFITYSQGYIHGAGTTPSKPYAAKPRIQQVVRVFGKYAEERGIKITVEVEGDVMAPLVPPSLYNGISLNLYTNALKAITASTSVKNKEISFRAWNDRNQHFLEVSDTGIGVPEALRSRIFDPLFSTTTSNRDPLGSGMGLGLSLVRRSLQAFGGRIDVTDPPPGFNTTFRVRLPIQ